MAWIGKRKYRLGNPTVLLTKKKFKMNPLKKAKELFMMYYSEILKTGEDISQEIIISVLSKECANMMCDEIILFNKNYVEKSFGNETNDIVTAFNNTNKFWQEVKDELEKL